MARPTKNNAEYFPHATSMRNHKKIKVLRNRFGLILGYAFWSMLLEYLTDQDGLELEYSDMEISMFASELGIKEDEARSLFDTCLNLRLLEKSESGFIYCPSLIDSLTPLFEKRNREREKSRGRKEREKSNSFHIKPTSGVVSAAETTPEEEFSLSETPQSKEKYIKVDKSKENLTEDFLDTKNVEYLISPCESLTVEDKATSRKKKNSAPALSSKEYTIGHKIRLLIVERIPEYYWEAKDAAHAKKIAQNLSHKFRTRALREPSDEEILNSLSLVLDNLPEFWQGKWDVAKLSSNLNSIVEQIKLQKSKPSQVGKIEQNALNLHEALKGFIPYSENT